MWSPRGMFAGCGLIALIIVCLVVFLPAQFMPRTDLVPNGSDVGMLQPGGRDPVLDFQNSQTNLNNSESNRNNSEGDYLDTVGAAQATAIVEKAYAESCDIRNDCNSGIDAKDAFLFMGTGAGTVLVIVVIVFLVIGIAVISRA